MQTGHLPPMSGGSNDSRLREVMCIEVRKVFDLCFQEHHIDRTFDVMGVDIPPGTMVAVECEIDQANTTCREVGMRRPVEGMRGKFVVSVAIEAPVTIRIVDQMNPDRVFRTIMTTIVFVKQAVLCAPDGTQVTCTVTGNCACVFERTTSTVTCAFDFCVVIRATANVNILVQSLGMCVPKRCEAVSTIGGVGCPPMPPQQCDDRDFTDDDSDDFRHRERESDHRERRERERERDRERDRVRE